MIMYTFGGVRNHHLRYKIFLYALPNNSFNPTALSLPFINLVWLRFGYMIMSGGGLIRALGF
jgi:hypothetical protein